LALAKLSLSGANVLLLDEPTNHLDIDAQEVLQAVLDDFHGTILLVSHDRYIIAALATQIWEIETGKLTVFNGTYQEYAAARKWAEEQAAVSSNGKHAKKSAQYADKVQGLNPYELKKRIAEIEGEIETLEQKLTALHQALEAASAAGNSAQVRALGEQYTSTEAALNSAMEQWGALVE
jgi:ATP-binding cassette subfamily F protein 3